MSIDKLSVHLHQNDVEQSRLLLHQILGTGRILKDHVFSNQVKQAQINVKANLFAPESVIGLKERLEVLGKELQKLCSAKERMINVVIYGKQKEQTAKLLEIIEQWPQVNTVKATNNIDSLNETIIRLLPELLLVAETSKREEDEKAFCHIKEAFLGTSIVSINDRALLAPNELIIYLKEKTFNCSN